MLTRRAGPRGAVLAALDAPPIWANRDTQRPAVKALVFREAHFGERRTHETASREMNYRKLW